jgi:hypothetical protein
MNLKTECCRSTASAEDTVAREPTHKVRERIGRVGDDKRTQPAP